MESVLKEKWELLEKLVGISDIKHKFNAYGWYKDSDYTISESDHWSGWWNDYYNFVDIWGNTSTAQKELKNIAEQFKKTGYDINPIINNGISIGYSTMSAEESHKKAYDNLCHGGRMSD